MRTASNSPLTQKYGDKTMHVSIMYRTVLFVLELISSPVLTQLRTGPKNAGSQFPSVKIAFRRGPPGPRGPTQLHGLRGALVPKHATA